MRAVRCVSTCVLLTVAACGSEPAPPEVSVGDVLDASLSWPGYPKGSVAWGDVSLSDYFDRDGQRGVHALLIVEARASCPACQQEAAEMPLVIEPWNELGIDVVHLLFRETNASAATADTALAWKTTFEADWAVAIDPEFTFGAPETTPIPLNLLVDPRTLTIVGRVEGYSRDFMLTVEELALQNQP